MVVLATQLSSKGKVCSSSANCPVLLASKDQEWEKVAPLFGNLHEGKCTFSVRVFIVLSIIAIIPVFSYNVPFFHLLKETASVYML